MAPASFRKAGMNRRRFRYSALPGSHVLVSMFIEVEETSKTAYRIQRVIDSLLLLAKRFNAFSGQAYGSPYVGYARFTSLAEAEAFVEEANLVTRRRGTYKPVFKIKDQTAGRNKRELRPRQESITTNKFWKLIDAINDDPDRIVQVVPPQLQNSFAEMFLELAGILADKASSALGEITDKLDYSSWGVVSEGKKSYNELLRDFMTDSENAAYWMVDEFDGEEFGSQVFELLEGN